MASKLNVFHNIPDAILENPTLQKLFTTFSTNVLNKRHWSDGREVHGN